MKSKTIILLLTVLVAFGLLNLFTTEKERKELLWDVKVAFRNNPSIPKIVKQPSFGQSECNNAISNPEYETYVQEATEKCIDQEAKKYPDLSEIVKINCKAESTFNSSSPPKTITTKTPCQVIIGYDKLFVFYNIAWFKVGFEAR